jgi:mediator of RNA polymerase II transcription subunit 17
MFKAQNLPRGSFGVQKQIETPKRQEDIVREQFDEERRRLAARGSRMQALEDATDTLLKAATQLETEIGREVKYWDEILSISQKGWSLQRLRRNVRHSPLAVRYGYPEASGQFKARGLAPLRMDKEGSIILDPALALKPKTLRVRISDNGAIKGTSHLPTLDDGTSLGIEKSIKLARESLFEEELYHEITMENRQLSAYGVELRNSVIHLKVPGSGHQTILIDCITRDDDIASSQDHSQDSLAQSVAEALRLLLTHEHHMRLYRRSQIPPPMTQHKRQPPMPPLLRTLLAMFSHLNAVDAVKNYFDVVVKTFKSAGLDTTVQMTRETSWEKLTKIIGESTREDVSATDQVFEAFVKPFDGLASLSLPNGTASEKLTVATRTYIGPPTFGTEFKVTLPSSLVSVLNLAPDQKRDFKFSSADEVESYIDWILSLDLSHTLLHKAFAGKAAIKSKEPRVTVSTKDGKKVFKKDVEVELTGGQLKVTVGLSPLTGTNTSSQAYTWDGSVADNSFIGKIKELVG